MPEIACPGLINKVIGKHAIVSAVKFQAANWAECHYITSEIQ
jgi:hypothetical protein